MAVIDMVGVPIPADHPAFAGDLKVLRKIKQVESLIELRQDMEDAEEASKALHKCLNHKNQEGIASLFGCPFWTISESLLSYIVVLYAKSFTAGTGRTSLSGEVGQIFGDAIEKHTYTIGLRNGFYAHHGIEANRHQLFCLPNVPAPGKVKLHPGGQSIRILMSGSIDLRVIDYCVLRAKEYLIQRIDAVCRSIQSALTPEQLEVISSTPRDELLDRHWRENSPKRRSPFSERKG